MGFCAIPVLWRRYCRRTRSSSLRRTRDEDCWCWGRSSWLSRAARRSTLTWALRPFGDSARLVYDPVTRAVAQLLRAGRLAADASGDRSQSLLLPGTRQGAVVPDPHGDGGGDHRLPGRHIGSVLPYAPGGAAGVHPTHGDRAHQLARDWADLCAQHQLDADGFDDCARLWFPVVE